MGGLGSKRWSGHVKKTTVADCLSLTIGIVSDCKGFRELIQCPGGLKSCAERRPRAKSRCKESLIRCCYE